MRLKIILFFFILNICAYSQKQKSSIGFIENKGQIIDQKGKQNKGVLYLLNTPGLNVQIKKNGFSYDIYETKKHPLSKKELDNRYTSELSKEDTIRNPNYTLEYIYHRIDIDFVNSNKMVELVADEKSIDYDNYYNVVNTPHGITNVYKYKKIKYKNLYNNIDVDFFIPKDTTKAVEYNFIVNKGGKISDIQLKFNGVKTNLIGNKIKMNVRFGQMEETLPLSWSENSTDKNEINIGYKKLKNNVYGFESSENLNNKKVIIDPTPVRLWGTYYGEVSTWGNSLSNDYLNNLYLSGSTSSTNNIATSGAFQIQIQGQKDGFIFKFSPNGNQIWGTYFGGEGGDVIYNSDINGNDLVISGVTQSYSNISTTGTHSSVYNPGNGINTGSGSSKNDCFIEKFNLNGQRIWGTYFGGESCEYPLDLAIDLNGNIIMVGESFSINGITTSGSFKETRTQPVNVNTVGEGFIAKFNNQGNQLWGTYYGLCEVRSVDTDSNNNIFISGDTSNGNSYIATPGTHQPIFSYNTQTGVSYYDSYIGKFNSNGQRIWGTYYGGYEAEYNFSLKVDLEDNIYISGNTRSTELISTPNSHQEINGGSTDAYLSKFNQNGMLIWGTYYGGIGLEDWGYYKIDINQNNEVFLSGSTMSPNNISTPGSYSENLNGSADIFIAKFNKNGTRTWGTYFGGNITEFCQGIKVDNIGGIYILGYTFSTNGITTPNSFQQYTNNSPARFLEKFFDCQSLTNVTSNSPICIGSSIQLNASGGINYDWTGPNGFTSSIQNPIINNASALNSGTYSCSITGTGGCDNTVTVNVLVGDSTAPVPNNQNLQTITGDCNTIISTIPTATDNCAGQLNGITVDPLNYTTPGNYTIHWNYNDGNGNSATQNQSVVITATALPILTATQQFCIQQNATLSNIAITGQNVKWYDAQTGGNILPINTILQNATTYYALQTNNNCESNRVPVTITIYNTPSPTANPNQSFCSTANATLNDIAISGTGVKWYDTQTGGNLLPANTIIQNATTYYASQTLNGCESVNRTSITINLINTLNANDFSDYFCDDLNSGYEKIDLTSYNSSLISNTAGNTFSFYKSYSGAQNQTPSEKINNEIDYQLNVGTITIYVRIDNVNTCHQIVVLNLRLYSKPNIPIAEVTPICQGKTVTINAGNFDKYLWSTGESTSSILVSQAGNYSVTVTENHIGINCTSSKDFKVVNSNVATISQVITNDWTVNDNSITIIVTTSSVGDYQYSLDGNNYQNSNVFTDLNSGEYKVFIRDKNGCGTISEEIFLLMYPKYFTPNGDGFNDKWKIKFSNTEPSLRIKLFDRYGKFIKELDYSSDGWNGTFNGKELPSTDYWFVVTRANGKEYKGHFAMKR
ncbi:MAG: T9SS type B sorting domain-containing protein [Flavobacterium sp.]|uniref:DUF7948 domain-containing protein n=1 Tax=Flavobacterium sp. TaxID=239 RepID=UPI0032633D4C